MPLWCGRCGRPIVVRSKSVDEATRGHVCGGPPPPQPRAFVVCEPNPRVILDRLDFTRREYHRACCENDHLRDVRDSLNERIDALETQLKTVSEELSSIKAIRCRAPSASPSYENLVRALQRVMKAPNRRRRFLALLHPDMLNRETLCGHAKIIRDAVGM